MSPTHWVMIGLAFWSTGVTFGMWMLRRRLNRTDELEKKAEGFVTRTELQQTLGGISEEGIEREKRITTAIQNQTLTIGSSVQELKQEIRLERQETRREMSEQRVRIDELMRLDRGGGFRRS